MDVEAAWTRHVIAELVAHVADCLAPLLPPELTLVAVGPQLVLTGATGSRRAIATHTVPEPAGLDHERLAPLARVVLSDAQDLVAGHLHTPWPLTPGGRPVHPEAAEVGGGVRLALRTSDDTEQVALPDFTLPFRPTQGRPAG